MKEAIKKPVCVAVAHAFPSPEGSKPCRFCGISIRDYEEKLEAWREDVKKKKRGCRCYINASYRSKTAWRTGKLPKPCPIHEESLLHEND